MTYPHQGNTGWSTDDCETARPVAGAILMAHYHQRPSHYLAQGPLAPVLADNKVMGLTGLDTRAVAKHIVAHNLKKALITTAVDQDLNREAVAAKIAAFSLRNGSYLAPGLLREPGLWESSPANLTMSDHEGHFINQQKFKDDGRPKLIVWDLGAAFNSLKLLSASNTEILLCPPETQADFFRQSRAQGLVILGGPSSQAMIDKYKAKAQEILKIEIPVFAAGLGAIVLASALGAEIAHADHPVFFKPQTLKNRDGVLYPVLGGPDFKLKTTPNNWQPVFTWPDGEAAWQDDKRSLYAQLWPYHPSSPQPLWSDFLKAIK